MLSFKLSFTLFLAATCLLMKPAVSIESVTTCESSHNVQHLSCASGVIRVQSALYGRMDSTTCSAGRPANQLTNTDCSQEGTVNALQKRCDGKMSCELTTKVVSNPDPCSGIYKYLQTNYTCFPAFSVTVCEHSTRQLFCDGGQEIIVYGAHYGRRDRTTCSYKRADSETENVDCINPTMKVAERCNGMTSCLVEATNSVLGDPCVGTYKYLEVAYACVYPSSSNDHDTEETSEEV